MFILVPLCLMLTISCKASELQVRVVELESVIKFNSGSSIKTCTVKQAEGCTFNVVEQVPFHLEISAPNGFGFKTWVRLIEGSRATLFVHLSGQRHHFLALSEPRVGDLINNRLLSGMVIPQLSGKLRQRVYFPH